MKAAQGCELKRKEFEKLLNLNTEIALGLKRLKSLRWLLRHPKAFAKSKIGASVNYDRNIIAKETETICQTMDEKIIRSVAYYKDILQSANEIEDPRVRSIVSLRCLDCLSEWSRIAINMGEPKSVDAVKRTYYRFFEKNNAEEPLKD